MDWANTHGKRVGVRLMPDCRMRTSSCTHISHPGWTNFKVCVSNIRILCACCVSRYFMRCIYIIYAHCYWEGGDHSISKITYAFILAGHDEQTGNYAVFVSVCVCAGVTPAHTNIICISNVRVCTILGVLNTLRLTYLSHTHTGWRIWLLYSLAKFINSRRAQVRG